MPHADSPRTNQNNRKAPFSPPFCLIRRAKNKFTAQFLLLADLVQTPLELPFGTRKRYTNLVHIKTSPSPSRVLSYFAQ
ncbi:hypothetical protein [Rubritalea tangerina]|uniref:hypothetical protein n=1 Tax=Rubritalea tangerina TaxID=430798 RepID=UPI0036209991